MNRSLLVAKVLSNFATANENQITTNMNILNKALANASDEALRKSYNAICEEYRRRFCVKFGYTDSSWMDGEIGGVLDAGGELFAMVGIINKLNTETK